ncbi:hypothetical protein UPYG_G00024560 [Umbra pygmaea]|uniref:Uncharacterized protein n=1 Tax=Umbra pygmaea TaxID=75934 RepID=A0ABD0XLK9_UMBPY
MLCAPKRTDISTYKNSSFNLKIHVADTKQGTPARDTKLPFPEPHLPTPTGGSRGVPRPGWR